MEIIAIGVIGMGIHAWTSRGSSGAPLPVLMAWIDEEASHALWKIREREARAQAIEAVRKLGR